MWKRNDGKSEDSILQNQFTAYLMTAVQRRKYAYLQKKSVSTKLEVSLEKVEFVRELQDETNLSETLPLLDQIENRVLLEALLQAKERELYILLARVLDEKNFADISGELGISYKATTHSYYRFIQKLRVLMGGDDE